MPSQPGTWRRRCSGSAVTTALVLAAACGGDLPARPDAGGEATAEVVAAFRAKEPVNPVPSRGDPYTAETDATPPPPDAPERVCALRYVDAERRRYELQTFSSADEARATGFIVTHQGHCGTCSTLFDLALYLERPNLTDPVRSCAAWSGDHPGVFHCLVRLGFTPACADTWAWNAHHTQERCFSACAWAWVSGAPSNRPDGSLSECLQCDEDQSGPVFKATAGRTRRNSGLRSSIDRPDGQVYPLVHDYF